MSHIEQHPDPRFNMFNSHGSARFQARVMYRLQQRAWLLSEIGDIWGVGRQYVHWLITMARNARRVPS